MKTELDGVRRRLNIAERDLVESKEECIQLTNTVQSLERDVCQINQTLRSHIKIFKLNSNTKSKILRDQQASGILYTKVGGSVFSSLALLATSHPLAVLSLSLLRPRCFLHLPDFFAFLP